MNNLLEEVKHMKQKITEQLRDEFELRGIDVDEKGIPIASHGELLECLKSVDQDCLDELLKTVNDLPLETILDRGKFKEDNLKNLVGWLLDEDGEAACFDSSDIRYVEQAVLQYVYESKSFPKDADMKDVRNCTRSLNLCLSFIANDQKAEEIMKSIFFATLPENISHKEKALDFVLGETKTKEGSWWVLNVLLAIMTKFVMVLEDEDEDKEYGSSIAKVMRSQIDEIGIRQRAYEYMEGGHSYIGGLNGDGNGNKVETIPLNLTREKIEEILSPYVEEITEETLGELSEEDLEEITKTVISTVGDADGRFNIQNYVVSGGIVKMLLSVYEGDRLSNLTAVKLSKSDIQGIMNEITAKVIEYDDKKTSFDDPNTDMASYVISNMDSESAELLMNIGRTVVLSCPGSEEELRTGVLGFIEKASESKLDFTCFMLIFSNFIRIGAMMEPAEEIEGYKEEAMRVANLVQSYGIEAVSDKDRIMEAVNMASDIDVRKCVKYVVSTALLSNSEEERDRKLSQTIIGISQLLGEPETPMLKQLTLDIRDAVWKAIEDLEIPVDWELSEEQKNVSLLRALLSISSEHTEGVRVKYLQEQVSNEFRKMVDFYMAMEDSVLGKMEESMDGNESENGSNEGESFERLVDERLGKAASNGAIGKPGNGKGNGSNKKPKRMSVRDILLGDDDD